jgi:hypothetical protein
MPLIFLRKRPSSLPYPTGLRELGIILTGRDCLFLGALEVGLLIKHLPLTNGYLVIILHHPTNLMDTIGNSFWITGVQLELGPVATPFENRSFAEELALCQRYYEKSYNLSSAPGSVSAYNGQVIELSPRNTANGTFGFKFATRKRANPIMTLYADDTGTADRVRNTGDKVASCDYIGESGVAYVVITSGNAADTVGFHWAANADF